MSTATETRTIEILKPNYSPKVRHFKNTRKSVSPGYFLEKLNNIRKIFENEQNRISVSATTAGFTDLQEGLPLCPECGLVFRNSEENNKPYEYHREQKPNCSFVLSKKISSYVQNLFPKNSTARTTIVAFNESENRSKRQKTEEIPNDSAFIVLSEVSTLEQSRRRTFSNWPSRNLPSSAQMIEAGFLNCNVGDRVICLYCNLICQQWTPHTDDPCEVHKTLRPDCIFVRANLIRPVASSIIILNETSSRLSPDDEQPSTLSNTGILKSQEIVFTRAVNPAYIELPKRHATYAQWPKENLPSVDDLTRAGFYYTGTRTIVTCFYCNGSLQNWGQKDNPTIEHARWFPNCAYAKQLCGDELYRKVQESKRAQQEKQRINEMKEKNNTTTSINVNNSGNNRQLVIQDESTLSRLVAARLDLPVSQRLLSAGYKLSIIKRCWEDQLRLKRDDFMSDSDLFIACLILKKQIEHIDGKKENIVIPSIKMKQLREQLINNTHPQASNICLQSNTENKTRVDSLPSQTATNKEPSAIMELAEKSEGKDPKTLQNSNVPKKEPSESNSANQCVLCWNEEKRLACIPCGHLATCVPCGHSLRSCPICRREIEAFVRVYI